MLAVQTNPIPMNGGGVGGGGGVGSPPFRVSSSFGSRSTSVTSMAASSWTPSGVAGDRSSPIESVLMVTPTDGLQGAGSPIETCEQCGYYGESNGQPVYGVDYVRYWDCCGASTASIESKVEQALDLVKNHLMFAVREEIRALKDEIDDLIRKNDRLEYENNVLRSHASPEVLARLAAGTPDARTSTTDVKAAPGPDRDRANSTTSKTG